MKNLAGIVLVGGGIAYLLMKQKDKIVHSGAPIDYSYSGGNNSLPTYTVQHNQQTQRRTYQTPQRIYAPVNNAGGSYPVGPVQQQKIVYRTVQPQPIHHTSYQAPIRQQQPQLNPISIQKPVLTPFGPTNQGAGGGQKPTGVFPNQINNPAKPIQSGPPPSSGPVPYHQPYVPPYTPHYVGCDYSNPNSQCYGFYKPYDPYNPPPYQPPPYNPYNPPPDYNHYYYNPPNYTPPYNYVPPYTPPSYLQPNYLQQNYSNPQLQYRFDNSGNYSAYQNAAYFGQYSNYAGDYFSGNFNWGYKGYYFGN